MKRRRALRLSAATVVVLATRLVSATIAFGATPGTGKLGLEDPGTIDDLGGSSTSEYRPLLRVVFPEPGFTTSDPIHDFNRGDLRKVCPVGPVFGR